MTGETTNNKEGKTIEEKTRKTSEPLQTLSHRLLEIQESERRHIARELHDEIGQALTAVKINLQAVQRFPDPSSLANRLEDSIGVIDRLLQQVRNLSLDLRPPLLDDLGLVPALRWYVSQQATRSGLQTRFRADSRIPRLDSAVETACFRVAQEAITNVIRHAHAVNLAVTLFQTRKTLHLVVHDDGIGFEPAAAQGRAEQGGSLGWIGMQERVSLVGGRMEWASVPKKGTEVHALFPVTSAFSGD